MLLDTFVKYTKTVVSNSVVKFNYKAKEYETVDSLRNADEYIAAIQKTDRFDLYPEFNIDSIVSAGLGHLGYDTFELASNPDMIPRQYRDAVLKFERQSIINDFIEVNDYYRTLIGKPSIDEDESNFIRLTENQYESLDIPNNQYIHDMSDIDIGKLNAIGLLDEIKKNNPDKLYLNFLGNDRINLVTARSAPNFSILKIDKEDVPTVFYENFMRIYEECRVYFTSVIYNKDVGSAYPLYDNFIGLCIMIMTIQRMVSNTFKDGIEREFYDWDFIQKLYKTYNLPFVETLSMDYHVLFMKNLNYLLRYKSTDKVLFDICSLLGRDRVEIYRHYLVKEQLMDENNNPVFYYKIKTDEHGQPILNEDGSYVFIEDINRMYELYFQGVNVNERNITLAMKDERYRTPYDEMIEEDPYWRHDEHLEKLLNGIGTEADGSQFSQPYNYVETKYLSLNVMYNMTDMLFEITYAFNMLLDKKEEINFITLTLPKIVSDASFGIFDVVVFLITLTCKINGFKDSIIMTPSKIANIYANTEEDYRMYAFNFDPEQIELIKSMIKENSKYIDTNTLLYFENLTIETEEDANALFIKIKEFNNFIIEKMRKSNNIKEYHLYKDIFNIAMTTEIQKNLFTIESIDDAGEVVSKQASTYLEYLENKQPILAEIVKRADNASITTMIDHVTSRINQIMPDLEYLFLLNDNNNPVYTALVALLKFFKSYTVDLTQLNIIYVFDSPHYNLIKLVEDIHSVDKILQPEEYFNTHYFDEIKSYLATIRTRNDILKFNEKYTPFIRLLLDDELLLYDELLYILSDMRYNEHLSSYYGDDLDITKLIAIRNELFNIYDECKTYGITRFKDRYLYDELVDINSIMYIIDELIDDKIELISKKYDFNIDIELKEKIKFLFILNLKSDMTHFIEEYDVRARFTKHDDVFHGHYTSNINGVVSKSQHNDSLIYTKELYRITYNN